MHNAGKSSEFDETHLAIQQDLQNRLAENVSAPVLAAEITRLLKLLGKHPGSFEHVAQYLAEKLAPRFVHKSEVVLRQLRLKSTIAQCCVAYCDSVRTVCRDWFSVA